MLKHPVYIHFFCLVWFLNGLIACTTNRPIQPPTNWPYEKEAIKLHIKAADHLNFYEGQPHPVVFCIYQMRQPSLFQDLIRERQGLYRLIEGRIYDPDIVKYKQISIKPSQQGILSIDREEAAQYIGIVVGYYFLSSETCTRIFTIPVIVERRALIRKTETSKVSPCLLNIELGPQAILQLNIQAHKE